MTLAFAGIATGFAFVLLIFYFGGYFSSGHRSGGHVGLVALIALYPSTVLTVFFNVALACAASAAFDGDRMSAREAMRIAYGKRRQILLWSLISAIVGTVISEIANRLPGGARIVGAFLGAAWGLATIFVVPILAMEGAGAVDALKRSSSLVRRRWGEGITGGIAIGTWAGLVAIPLAFALGIGVALLQRHPAAAVTMIGVGLVGLVALSTAMIATRQVFAVALYRYAIDAPIGGFAPSDLEYPFVPRKEKRKSWILRIGGVILGFFLLLVVIGMIVAPHRHTAADGYFKVEYRPRQATGLSVGSPVVLNHQLIGSVIDTERNASGVRVEFHVDPRLREIIETTPAYVVHPKGRAYMRIGGFSRP